jgi:hypothetical protein
MKRHEWKFLYTASELASAALTKRDTHQAKFEWWENKKKEVMKSIGDGGIEVHDSVAASYSNTKGSFSPQIRIDATLQRDLTECQEKIMEHHELVQAYNGWLQVLSANKNDRLELNHDDYLFFFGK